MNSRERVLKAINHEEADRVPIDLGGSIVTGIMARALVRLRRHLGMDGDVRVYDVLQMLGEVTLDLVERLGIDVLPIQGESISFGLLNRDYKPWTLFDGTPVLMPGAFRVEVSPEGEWLLHKDGDPRKPVIARMPRDGFYFDDLNGIRMAPDFKPPAIESLRAGGWWQVQDETLRYMQEQARLLRCSTDKALVLLAGGLGVPMVSSFPDWLILLATEKTYIRELMGLGAEIALENLARYWQALGDDVDVIIISTLDYGGQNRELFSPALFEELFVPCYKVQCDWIHRHTPWKVFVHCCGSIPNLIEPLIRAGVDILNPVQTSAAGMDPWWLKSAFGERITFWGGGVDTQRVLPFGTPEEVHRDVAQRIRIFAPGGGFVWAAIHNIQCDVPPENIVAAIETVHELGWYPVLDCPGE